MSTCLDAESNLCYTELDAEQDYDSGCVGRRAGRRSNGVRRAIMHPR
jgi:hypothetical protein